MACASPLPGWACYHTSHPPRRLATAAQWHVAWPSRSGSGRSVSESGTPPSAPSSAPPVSFHTQVRSLVSAPWDHYLSATQTSGALLPAYGTSSSLECDSGHTSSPPPRGSGCGSVRVYGHSHAKCCDFAGLILSVSTRTVNTDSGCDHQLRPGAHFTDSSVRIETSGARLPAYITIPILECYSGHTSSPPPCGFAYGSLLDYGHSHTNRCDFAG